MRINKFLAQSGLGSRRKVEELILDGKVSVNGVICTNLSTQISKNDNILVENKPVKINQKLIYIMLNKPKGYLSSTADQFAKPSVLKLININEKIYPVGRLDYNTEGLLLLTNDGDFTNKVISPKFEIDKEYYVKFKPKPTQEQLKKLQSEMIIDGYTIRPAKISNIKSLDKEKCHELNIIIHEGRNRQIRKMFENVGLKVVYLKRIRIGQLYLDNLQVGKYKVLTKSEAEKVFK